MKDLSLHILDVVENSIHAGSTKIEIVITEDKKNNKLVIKIKDNGKGLNKDELIKVRDPFYTTKKTKQVGLGIPMLAQSAREAEGNIKITSSPRQGEVRKKCRNACRCRKKGPHRRLLRIYRPLYRSGASGVRPMICRSLWQEKGPRPGGR